ncbi:MAG TPA: S8 family serine peptidase [Candidatus Limnocylindrales bacterium]|nr:S8 family serine peptidase [Candidatus Limnocylindrales bacterium]
MRLKILSGLGIVVPLCVGVILLLSHKPASAPTPLPAPITVNTPSNGSYPGQVVANDETAYSPPRQISVPDPASALPSYVSAKSAKKPQERTVVINNKEYPVRTYKPLLTPNDPLVGQAWVTTTKTDQAWNIPTGSRQTLLAIIDTGFGLKHEEFKDRWYINSGESGAATSEQPSIRNCTDKGLPLAANCNLIDDNSDGIVDNETGTVVYQNASKLNCTDQSKPLDRSCNRIDDDGNGYIDDVQGWDFINYDNSVQAGELNPSGSGTSHGTMVAGVAAATGNNGKGLAGVDWNTKILPIQAIDDDSYGDTRSVGQAIYYAAAQGADVISLSLGSDLSDEYVQEAVQAAIEAGSVVVAASGNDGCDCMLYPANYPEVVAVGALDNTNQRASFSSWGANLDIMAPGTQINTSTWLAANPVSSYANGVNGTSFATPIVSGLLTRLLSLQPAATPLQLIAALTENSNRLTVSTTTPKDTKLGFGLMDAAKAINRMVTSANTSLLYGFHPISKGNFLNSASETIASYAVHSCPGGIIGTTPVYELIKSNSRFFSISATEVFKAVKAGYSSQLFTYACLQQPHDASAFVRDINLFSEFRNIFRLVQ